MYNVRRLGLLVNTCAYIPRAWSTAWFSEIHMTHSNSVDRIARFHMIARSYVYAWAIYLLVVCSVWLILHPILVSLNFMLVIDTMYNTCLFCFHWSSPFHMLFALDSHDHSLHVTLGLVPSHMCYNYNLSTWLFVSNWITQWLKIAIIIMYNWLLDHMTCIHVVQLKINIAECIVYIYMYVVSLSRGPEYHACLTWHN